MILSFGYTYQYLPAKTVTRRNWSENYYQQWVKAWNTGKVVHQAWDYSPYVKSKNPKQIGIITLSCAPCREKLLEMPESDLIAEGGMCTTVQEFINKYFDGNFLMEPVVIRFQFTPIEVIDV